MCVCLLCFYLFFVHFAQLLLRCSRAIHHRNSFSHASLVVSCHLYCLPLPHPLCYSPFVKLYFTSPALPFEEQCCRRRLRLGLRLRRRLHWLWRGQSNGPPNEPLALLLLRTVGKLCELIWNSSKRHFAFWQLRTGNATHSHHIQLPPTPHATCHMPRVVVVRLSRRRRMCVKHIKIILFFFRTTKCAGNCRTPCR